MGPSPLPSMGITGFLSPAMEYWSLSASPPPSTPYCLMLSRVPSSGLTDSNAVVFLRDTMTTISISTEIAGWIGIQWENLRKRRAKKVRTRMMADRLMPSLATASVSPQPTTCPSSPRSGAAPSGQVQKGPFQKFIQTNDPPQYPPGRSAQVIRKEHPSWTPTELVMVTIPSLGSTAWSVGLLRGMSWLSHRKVPTHPLKCRGIR